MWKSVSHLRPHWARCLSNLVKRNADSLQSDAAKSDPFLRVPMPSLRALQLGALRRQLSDLTCKNQRW